MLVVLVLRFQRLHLCSDPLPLLKAVVVPDVLSGWLMVDG